MFAAHGVGLRAFRRVSVNFLQTRSDFGVWGVCLRPRVDA